MIPPNQLIALPMLQATSPWLLSWVAYHLPELAGRTGQSAKGMRQICCTERGAYPQIGRPSEQPSVWPETTELTHAICKLVDLAGQS